MFHYENPFLLGVAGNTAIDQHDGGTGIPNRTVCFAYGLGSNALSTPITWRVSDFTGLPLPADQPLPVFQAGVNNAWYGSNACQIYQDSMGFQVHKPSSSNPAPKGSIYGMQMATGFDLASNPIRPWADSYGPGARLRLQTYYDSPVVGGVARRYATPGTVQYGQIVVNLVDMTSLATANPRNLFYSIHMFDSRGHQPESVQYDTAGTSNPIVVTDFFGNQQYSTMHGNSQNTNGTSSCGCLWYGAYVTRANLLNAVSSARTLTGWNFSPNPNDYAINLAATGTEMFSPPGNDGWIGSRVWEFKVLTEK